MKRSTSMIAACAFAALALAPLATVRSADPLESGFARPPASTKPWCYWYWISDDISREGITRDLEAMARVGIGKAFIGNVDVNANARGRVKVLTEAWWGMVEHAVREGGRLGVDIGIFNCPGWSQSGGPWVKPEQSMRYLAVSETRVRGPARFKEALLVPALPFQDVAVLAFRAPRYDADTAAAHAPRVTSTPEAKDVALLFDGKTDTVCAFPAGASGKTPFAVDIQFDEPFTARSLLVHPAPAPLVVKGELLADDGRGAYASVRTFTLDRHNASPNVGFVPFAPAAIAFPPVTSRRFRLVFTPVSGKPALAEIVLSGAVRLERFPEKQLAKMFQDPLPMWDHYLWPPQPEIDAPDLAVDPGEVKDLSGRLSADGGLTWDVPEGEWIIQRFGMMPTGVENSPASPEGTGLEVDKMNRRAVASHFDAFVGRLLARIPAPDRKAFTDVVADSYEMGSQNWTDGFGDLFRATCGYDPRPWLPVLTGRIVGDADRSDRFLWDLRRLVADRVAYDYVGGLREMCGRNGLRLWLENYGHWGFPAEFLQYGGASDQVSGEFWATGNLGSIELRAASSAAHIYGKPIVSAEAFTGGPHFSSTPWSLKRRCDWAATEGINHFVLHVYIHQPDERRPGVNAWFGTEFNRHNTWFAAGRSWIEYIRRSHFLLQQGRHVADVAYFIGEDTPKMTGARAPELPPGYDFDYINAEVIEKRLRVEEGRFVLPDGMSYRLLVLPDLATMRPKPLRKIRDLIAAGGAVLGDPPSRSPSLEGYPACDDEVKQLAAEVWGGAGNRVFRGTDLAAVLAALETPPDVAGVDPKRILWIHRATAEADIYFLSNQRDRATTIAPVFRIRGKAPELWDADDGCIVKTAMYEPAPGGVRVPIELAARGSVFVVFREPAGNAPAVTEVTREGEVILSTSVRADDEPAAGGGGLAANTFTIAGWMRPDAEIDLPPEADAGVALDRRRNDAIFPAHGDSLVPGGGHAGAGISAGRNGVCVYEHSGDYFAPILVHAAALADWTHVAVVYRDGRPSLHLNGKLARRGLKSRYVVHPSPAEGGGAGGPFRGDLGELRTFGRALAESELAALVRSGPPRDPSSPLPPVVMARGTDGLPEAVVSAAGSYRAKLSDGRVLAFEVQDLPAPVEIAGPWEVRFPAGMDVPERTTFDRLISWTEHPSEAIRYFSGTATYARTCAVDPSLRIRAARILLDLGRVEGIAEVILNGTRLGILWKPPFVVDATDAVKPGSNALEVRVTNVWRNRLIGDKKYPKGFPGAGDLAFKPRLAVDVGIRADEALVPSGLIGPVRWRWSKRMEPRP
ncbi:MAG: hypothetical protein JXP34_20670 [Planctomycetes bacterium]|nr:hypothetical protein [Planctomycetota bacterium]